MAENALLLALLTAAVGLLLGVLIGSLLQLHGLRLSARTSAEQEQRALLRQKLEELYTAADAMYAGFHALYQEARLRLDHPASDASTIDAFKASTSTAREPEDDLRRARMIVDCYFPSLRSPLDNVRVFVARLRPACAHALTAEALAPPEKEQAREVLDRSMQGLHASCEEFMAALVALAGRHSRTGSEAS